MWPPQELFAVICAVLSFASSLCVVLTGLFFRNLMNRHFFRILFLISLSELFGSMLCMAGFPNETDLMCQFQGAFTLFFYRLTFFYTVCLSIQIYSITKYDRLILVEFYMHIACWLLTILLAVLPFSDSAYGQDDTLSGISWCNIDGATAIKSRIWLVLCLYAPLIICLGILFYLFVQMQFFRDQNTRMSISQTKVKSVVDILRLYPLGMMCCWLPNAAVGIGFNFLTTSMENVERWAVFVTVTQAIGTLYGLVLAVLFFSSSHEVRRRWKELLCCCNFANGIHKTGNVETPGVSGESQIVEDDIDVIMEAYESSTPRVTSIRLTGVVLQKKSRRPNSNTSGDPFTISISSSNSTDARRISSRTILRGKEISMTISRSNSGIEKVSEDNISVFTTEGMDAVPQHSLDRPIVIDSSDNGAVSRSSVCQASDVETLEQIFNPSHSGHIEI